MQEGTADLLEEGVDFERLLGVDAVDDGEGVEFDLVFFEAGEAAHGGVEGGFAVLVIAVEIVDGSGTIDGEADEEVVLGEEFTPRVVEEGAVGLEGVGDIFAVGELLLEGDDFLEEGDSEEGGFAALPGEVNIGTGLGVDVLLDVGLEDVVGHGPVALVGVEGFFFEIEAVGAVEVADGADGLGEDVEVEAVLGVRVVMRWSIAAG